MDQRSGSVDYRRAVAEASAYLERIAEQGRAEPDLTVSCPDAAAIWRSVAYPVPALDPSTR